MKIWRCSLRFMVNTKEKVTRFFEVLDERMDSKVEILILGGTALTMLDYKEYSLDVDVIILSCPDTGKFVDLYVEIAKELGVEIGHEPFSDFDTSLLIFKDYVKKSEEFLELKLKNIKIRTMAIEDIIISKFWRRSDKDIKDIERLLELRKVSSAQMRIRYKELMRQQWIDIRPKLHESQELFFRTFGHLLH